MGRRLIKKQDQYPELYQEKCVLYKQDPASGTFQYRAETDYTKLLI